MMTEKEINKTRKGRGEPKWNTPVISCAAQV
jgi:hypothetical protein